MFGEDVWPCVCIDQRNQGWGGFCKSLIKSYLGCVLRNQQIPLVVIIEQISFVKHLPNFEVSCRFSWKAM